MSVPQKINKLRTFLAQNPAMANSPMGIVEGIYLTPRIALEMLQRGQSVQGVINALAVIGVDPPEQDWSLVEGYYKSMERGPGKTPTTYIIPQGKVVGESLSVQDALAHIRQRDAIGLSLLKSYQSYLGEMSRRMQKA